MINFSNLFQWAFLKLKFEIECCSGGWEQVGDWCQWGDGRSPGLGECTIHICELNESESVRHLERRGSQKSGGTACASRYR